MKTVRLIYPQWQGADIVRLVPEVKDPAVLRGDTIWGPGCWIFSLRQPRGRR